MSQKNIFIFAGSWLPHQSSRAIQNFRLLSNIPEVYIQVFTMNRNSSMFQNSKITTTKISDRLKVHYIPTTKNVILKRLKYHLGFYKKTICRDNEEWAKAAYNFALKQHVKTDLIFSISNPTASHFSAFLFKQRFLGIPWLCYFSDPWTEWGDVNFGEEDPKIIDEEKFLESSVFQIANSFIFPTEQLMNYFINLHPTLTHKQTFVLPQTYGDIEPAGDHDSQPIKSKKLIISYVGSWYNKRQPDNLLQLLKLYKKKYPKKYSLLQIQFIGPVENIEKFQPDFDMLNILSHGQVSQEKALDFILNSDVLLHVGVSTKQDFYRPSKLIDYLTARKPILGLCSPGAETEFIRRANGIVGNIMDPLDVINAIDDLINLHIEHKLKFYRPSIDYCRQFHVDTVRNQFISILSELFSHRFPQ